MQNNLGYPAIGIGGDYERSQGDINLYKSGYQSDLGYSPYDECPAVRLGDVIETHICCRFNQQQQKILKAALKERERCSYE